MDFVVVVVVGAIVLDGGIVDVTVSLATLEALEHAIMSMPIPAIMSGDKKEWPSFCLFRPKLVYFTSRTLEG